MCGQVQDGMLEETEAVITVDISHTNSAPLPACETGEGGLFGETWSGLNALTTMVGRNSAPDRQEIIQALITERDTVLAADPLKLVARTTALDLLASGAAQGKIIAGTDTSFDLACTSSGSWTLPMAPSQAESLTALNVSILAYDSDEFEGLTYRIVQSPENGVLYASTARVGDAYTQVLAACSRLPEAQSGLACHVGFIL